MSLSLLVKNVSVWVSFTIVAVGIIDGMSSLIVDSVVVPAVGLAVDGVVVALIKSVDTCVKLSVLVMIVVDVFAIFALARYMAIINRLLKSEKKIQRILTC